MSKYQDEVRATFRGLEVEEIQARLRAGTLTDEARAVAEEEIRSRGEEPELAAPHPEPSPLIVRHRPSLKTALLLYLSGAVVALFGIFFVFSTFVQLGLLARGATEPVRHLASLVLSAFLVYVSFKVLAGIGARLKGKSDPTAVV